MSRFWKELIAVLVLIIIILLCLRTCENKKNQEYTTKIDTLYIYKYGVLKTTPTIINSIAPAKIETKYLPDKNYDKLLSQYNDLVNQFLTKNIERDSIRLDSLGYAKIIDTVEKNRIKGRKFEYHLKIPEITKTITAPCIAKRQFYLGGEVQGTQMYKFNQIEGKLLYKTRDDHIYGIGVGIGSNAQLNYGLSYYWKIK